MGVCRESVFFCDEWCWRITQSKPFFRVQALTVDGRNPANQLSLVISPIIYELFTCQVGFLAGFPPLNGIYSVGEQNKSRIVCPQDCWARWIDFDLCKYFGVAAQIWWPSSHGARIHLFDWDVGDEALPSWRSPFHLAAGFFRQYHWKLRRDSVHVDTPPRRRPQDVL